MLPRRFCQFGKGQSAECLKQGATFYKIAKRIQVLDLNPLRFCIHKK